MAIIVIRRPGQQEETAPLPSEEVVIGRLPDCAITVDDRAVSRHHVALSPGLEGEDYRGVRDLGSRNGTWVNGKRVRGKEVTLHNGDRIQLGRSGVVLSYFNDDATVTQERGAVLGLSYAGPVVDLGWGGSRWLRLLRLVGTILGIVGPLLGIAFWISRLLAG